MPRLVISSSSSLPWRALSARPSGCRQGRSPQHVGFDKPFSGAFHVRDDVLHVRYFSMTMRSVTCTLPSPQCGRWRCAPGRSHHVLGDSFGSASSRLTARRRSSGVAPRGTRAGDGAQGDFLAAIAVFSCHQNLGRGADICRSRNYRSTYTAMGSANAGAVQSQRRIDIRLGCAADLYLHQVARHHVFMRLGAAFR